MTAHAFGLMLLVCCCTETLFLDGVDLVPNGSALPEVEVTLFHRAYKVVPPGEYGSFAMGRQLGWVERRLESKEAGWLLEGVESRGNVMRHNCIFVRMKGEVMV